MDANKPSYEELAAQVSELQGKLAGLSGKLGENPGESKSLSDSVERGKSTVRQSLNTDLVNSVLHKIKAPLDTIIGVANLLSSSRLDAVERRNLGEIIANCSGELQGIISEFVSHNSLESEKETVELQKVSLNQLMDDLKIKFLNQVFYKGLTLRSFKGLSDEDDVVMIDEQKITQIFTSLLNNALKFTSWGFIEMGYRVINDEIKFFVKDSGAGLEDGIKEKLSSEQFKLNKVDDETEVGLGLSTVKRYVDLLGGTLKVASQTGVGTVFSFKVPYVPAEADEAPVEAKKTIKVLIAEDEEISYLLLKKLLEKGNVEIIRAKTGEEAYEIYKNNPDINLVLMDLKMPQVDGYTAAQLIRNEAPDLPIIAQSGYSFKDDNEFYTTAFNAYISKPVSKSQFEEVVTKYVNAALLN